MVPTSCNLTEQELWSGIDRHASDVTAHLATCPTCRTRAAGIRAGIEAITAASTPSTPLPNKIGSYIITGRLGEGGMGIVYEGEQQTPKRLVAVKVIRGGQCVDEYRLKLFQREVQTLAHLKHPAIGAIYEAGRTEDGQHFFAMELVRGERLNEYVTKHQVSRRERLQLFAKICDAIHYAHLRGVIHRDLKPSNIIVDAEGNPKILDFGLARINDPDLVRTTTGTEIGKIMGTLPYMSPEEARGNPEEIDVRSDVYSLGVMLFEMLAGQLPYMVSNVVLHEAVRVICEDPPRRPAVIDRTLRGDPETIILKTLEKERGRRYQSAAAIAEDVRRYLADQPILARRSNALYQLRKFVQRHILVVTFTAAILTIIAASAYWINRAERDLRAGTELNDRLKDLEVAISKSKLAALWQKEGEHNRAEQFYREALATFERLEQDKSRTGETMLGLAMVLASGDHPDYVEAEQRMRDALEIVPDNPAAANLHKRVLEALRSLYQTHLDKPEELRKIEARLSALEGHAPAPRDRPLPETSP